MLFVGDYVKLRRGRISRQRAEVERNMGHKGESNSTKPYITKDNTPLEFSTDVILVNRK